MTQFEIAQHLFSDFGIQVTKSKPKKDSDEVVLSRNHAVQEALEKELMRAKRELSAAKKSMRMGKCNADEVFDYEWRVHEIKQQLDQLGKDRFDELD